MKYYTSRNKIYIDFSINSSLGPKTLTNFQLRCVFKLIKTRWCHFYFQKIANDNLITLKEIENTNGHSISQSSVESIYLRFSSCLKIASGCFVCVHGTLEKDKNGPNEKKTTTTWNPVDILEMTRPVPLTSKPRVYRETGKKSYEWIMEGGCPEVDSL